MGYYGYWDSYERKAPINVKNGIKSKSEHGAIGETWWSKRWIKVLESFTDSGRLSRGRSYARKGQVISIDIEVGLVKAKVQGSDPRPYNVKIQLKPLSAPDWNKVTDAMAEQAIFAAKLLAGEMPTNIEEAFNAVNIALFPKASRDLDTKCTCPDSSNPCKHIAAVYYLLAERFDEDPFLIFKLRGQTKEQIIATLREKRVGTVESALEPSEEDSSTVTETPLPLLEEKLDTFWQAGEALDTFTVKPGTPEVDKAILKRLGNAPFTIGNENMAILLAKAYDAVDAAVRKEMEER
jgi:uncharacterized Zn finger protein